jgi:two-component sensor histidine kinase
MRAHYAMKNLIWLLVALFVCSSGVSQKRGEADSIRRLLHDSSKTNLDLTEINARLAWLFHNASKYDSAISYYRRALAVPYNKSKVNWLASIYFGLGSAYSAQGKNDSAVLWYKQAITLYRNYHDNGNLASSHTNLAIVYIRLGLYEEALSSALEGLKIFESEGPSPSLASCYQTLASIETRIDNYPEAINYYRLAIALFTKFDTAYLARSYNNLGEIFISLHQYDSARVNLLRSIDIKQKLKDTKGVARTINNLGKVSMLRGNSSVAESQFRESIALQMQIEDRIGMIEVLNNLGQLYLNTNRYEEADRILARAEDIIHASGTPEHLRQNLELHAQVAKLQGNFRNGMNYMDQLIVIRDSLMSEEKSKTLQGLQVRYETEKKEQQIMLLEQREEINRIKIRNSQVLIITLVSGLILVAAIGLLISINLRNAKAAKRRIEILFGEMNHRIKNNFQTLASIFHLQTRYYTDQQMVLEARNSESRIHTMSLLHEKFSSAETDHTISTQAFITDLVNKLVDIYGVRSRQLQLSLHVEEIEIDVDKALALSLIMQELICNAFKYAFDQQPNPELAVDVRSADRKVIATIRDNGLGISQPRNEKSQGLNLVEALTSQLEGTIDINNQGGTSFIITFPIIPSWKKRLFS